MFNVLIHSSFLTVATAKGATNPGGGVREGLGRGELDVEITGSSEGWSTGNTNLPEAVLRISTSLDNSH